MTGFPEQNTSHCRLPLHKYTYTVFLILNITKVYGVCVGCRGTICTPRVLKYSRPVKKFKKYVGGGGGYSILVSKANTSLFFSPCKEIK